MEECGEGVEDTFRERGYSEGDKDRNKRRKGLFRRLSGESDSTMTLGKKNHNKHMKGLFIKLFNLFRKFYLEELFLASKFQEAPQVRFWRIQRI